MNTIKLEIEKRIPGLLYLVLAITGFYTPFVMDNFNSTMDPSEWFEIISMRKLFFTSGIISFYIMNIVWLLLAYSLYDAFKHECKRISSMVLLSVVAGSIIVFIIIILKSTPLYLFSLITEISDINKTIWIEHVHSIFLISSKANISTYLFYSIWLFPLAVLFLKTDSISKVERITLFLSLIISGIGYMIDFLLFHLFPMQNNIKITEFTFYGEVVVLLWLLVKGFKIKIKDEFC